MLVPIAVILLLLWALGLISSVSMGGFIHLLLVLALVVIVMHVLREGSRLYRRDSPQPAAERLGGRVDPKFTEHCK